MTSESSNPLDAYQPPKPVESEAGPVMRKTGRIKAICIIAIVLGCLGLFSALAGTVGLMFGKQIQSAVSPPNQPGVNQEMIRVQEEMQKDLQSAAFSPCDACLPLGKSCSEPARRLSFMS